MPNNLHCLFPFALFLAILPLVSQGQTLQTRNFFQQEDNHSIAVDGDFVWLGTAKSGVLQYHRNGVLLDQLTMDDGLAGNTVYAILIDQTGGRWFATDKGLSEYTQTGWKTHFNGQTIHSVAQAADGTIWCAADKTYARAAGSSTWVAFPLAFVKGSVTLLDEPFRIRTLADGSVFVCSGLGLAIRKPQDSLFTTYGTYFIDDVYLERDRLTDVAVDTAGHVWVVKGNVLQIFQDGNFLPVSTLLDDLPNAIFNRLFAGPDGAIYLGAGSGLCRYNGTPALEMYLYQPGFREVFDIVWDGMNDGVLFSHETGFSAYKSNSFTHYQHREKVLSDAQVRQMKRDSTGKIWVLGKTLTTEVKQEVWTTHRFYDSRDSLRFIQDAVFEPGGAQNFLIGNFHMRKDGSTTTIFNAPDTLFSYAFQKQIEWDPIRQRVVATSNFRDGLFWLFEGDHWEALEAEPALVGCGVFENLCNNDFGLEGFFVSPQGDYYWMDKFRMDRTGPNANLPDPPAMLQWECIDIHFECPAGFDDCQCNRFHAVAFRDSGRVWLGTDAGVFEAAYGGGITNLWNTNNSLLPNDTILSLAEDAAGRLWIGTRGGLGVVHADSLYVFTSANAGLAGDVITSILHEPGGSTWIGTETGISKVSFVTSAISTPTPKSAVQVFPNPTGHLIQFATPFPAKIRQVLIWDVQGKNYTDLVSRSQVSADNWALDVNRLPPGLYLLEVQSESEYWHARFVKQ